MNIECNSTTDLDLLSGLLFHSSVTYYDQYNATRIHLRLDRPCVTHHAHHPQRVLSELVIYNVVSKCTSGSKDDKSLSKPMPITNITTTEDNGKVIIKFYWYGDEQLSIIVNNIYVTLYDIDGKRPCMLSV